MYVEGKDFAFCYPLTGLFLGLTDDDVIATDKLTQFGRLLGHRARAGG